MSHHKSRPPARQDKQSLSNKMQPPNELPLPVSTINVFRDIGATSDNVGLLFNRYLRFVGRNWAIDTYQIPGKKPGTLETKNAKQWNLEQIINAQNNLREKWQNEKDVFYAAVCRWKEMVKKHTEPFSMTPEWRFIIGIGDKTALEVGFTFHRIYGFPIIPGSALKGLTRAYALWELAEKLDVPRLSLSQVKEYTNHKPPKRTPLQLLDAWLIADDERLADRTKTQSESDKQLKKLEEEVKHIKPLLANNQPLIATFRQIFGTPHAAGEAIFFDAMPAEFPQLEIDVMNVHYPGYYGEQGKEFPSDNQNPNPIPFLTVGRSAFWFAIGWRGQPDETVQAQVVTWLKKGLSEFGVGAKTAAGYGYFETEM